MKKMTIIASIVALASAAAITTFALGGGPKIKPFFEAKATSKSFTFNAATGEQFINNPELDQEVKVATGSTDPIMTLFMPMDIGSLAFGQNGRFVEVHPIAGEGKFPNYSLSIGINNLTHFAIDVGVENDGEGYEDMYDISLNDKGGFPIEQWMSRFKLDGDGNGTVHIEWDKGDYGGTVVGVFAQFDLEEDSPDANLYIESLSLAWDC